MTAPTVTIIPYVAQQFFDLNGNPLAGGTIATFLAGTQTPATTYTDSTGATANANPVPLDSSGFPESGGIWLSEANGYHFTAFDQFSNQIWDRDNIPGQVAVGTELTGLSALSTLGYVQRTGTGTYTANTPTVAFSGAATGSGNVNTTIALTLANSGVSGATYGSTTQIPQIAVNAKGIITSASNVTPALFTDVAQGEVAASGGGTVNFLRADGTWDQPSASSGSGSLTAQGHWSFPGGLIVQWGSFTYSGSNVTVTFPIAFPNAAFSVTTTQPQSTMYGYPIAVASLSTSSFVFSADGGASTTIYWQAVGH